MDWKTFFVELVKALAWPGLIGILVYQYRSVLRRLLFSLLAMFRKVQTLKYGDLVIATRTVNEALKANESEVEKAKTEIINPNTPPDERKRLADKIRDAAEESAQLRSTLNNLQSKFAELTLSNISNNKKIFTPLRLFKILRDAIGAHEIISLYEASKTEIIDRASSVISEACMPGNNSNEFSPENMEINQALGFIDPQGGLTELGADRLYRDTVKVLRLGNV